MITGAAPVIANGMITESRSEFPQVIPIMIVFLILGIVVDMGSAKADLAIRCRRGPLDSAS